MLLRAIKQVRDDVLQRCGTGAISLEVVSAVFTNLTIIDKIIYVRYVSKPSNPIWGSFCRWSKSPGVYSAAETMVEVRYASHLDEPWRRFVVCKELCHALDTAEGCHSATAGVMLNLVQAFSLKSAAIQHDATFLPMQSEILAEIGAIEILCPYSRRKAMGTITPIEAAQAFNIPLPYAALAVDSNFSAQVQAIIEAD